MQKVTIICTNLWREGVLICSFLSLFIFMPLPAAAVDSPHKTAMKLYKEGQELLMNKKLNDGISKLEKALRLAIELKDGYLVIKTYKWLGFGYLAKRDIRAVSNAYV